MSSPVAKPTPEILAWSDYEIGVMIHYDIEVYDPEARKNWNALIDIGKWKPTALDTDQWVRTAKAGGARYALLTAKHGTVSACGPQKSTTITSETPLFPAMSSGNSWPPAADTASPPVSTTVQEEPT